jgi:hypothetical protein
LERSNKQVRPGPADDNIGVLWRTQEHSQAEWQPAVLIP